MTACGGGQMFQQVQGLVATTISVRTIYLVLLETLLKASI
jgi:hypothetical protein